MDLDEINKDLKKIDNTNNKLLDEENKLKDIKEEINNEELKKLQKCKKDNDCKKDEYCAFNENDENHYCIPNKIYLGCLNNADQMYRFLKSSDKKYNENMDSCINFARKLNNNEIIYDYIHYRPKVETPIKKKSIQVDLKCGDAKIINLSYEDSFKDDCDSTNENCKVVPKDTITKILENNLPNCPKNYHLNIDYTCDIENIDKNIKIDLNKDNISKLNFDLVCPVNQKNNKYESQCTLFSFKDQDNINLDKMFDSNISQQKCDYASYLIPNIINDINEYNLKKNKKLEKSIESFNDIINTDQEELNKKKALQYMVEYEKKFNKKISYEDSLLYVQSIIEHATDQSSINIWDTVTGANKIPFINNSLNYRKYPQIGTSSKTFDSVQQLLDFVNADPGYKSTSYPDYIVYFAKSSFNNTNSGKAFAISFGQLKEANKVETTSWINNTQSTSGGTGGAAFTIINKSPNSSTQRTIYFSDKTTKEIKNSYLEIDNSLKKLKEYQNYEENIISNKNDEIQKNINYMNQRIRNSNYQSDMNKKIIRYLYITLILVFIITLAYFIYMSQLSNPSI